MTINVKNYLRASTSISNIISLLLATILVSCVTTDYVVDEPTVTIDGTAVYRIGSGDPIVVIPGGPGFSSKLYRKILGPLSEEYEWGRTYV